MEVGPSGGLGGAFASGAQGLYQGQRQKRYDTIEDKDRNRRYLREDQLASQHDQDWEIRHQVLSRSLAGEKEDDRASILSVLQGLRHPDELRQMYGAQVNGFFNHAKAQTVNHQSDPQDAQVDPSMVPGAQTQEMNEADYQDDKPETANPLGKPGDDVPKPDPNDAAATPMPGDGSGGAVPGGPNADASGPMDVNAAPDSDAMKIRPQGARDLEGRPIPDYPPSKAAPPLVEAGPGGGLRGASTVNQNRNSITNYAGGNVNVPMPHQAPTPRSATASGSLRGGLPVATPGGASIAEQLGYTAFNASSAKYERLYNMIQKEDAAAAREFGRDTPEYVDRMKAVIKANKADLDSAESGMQDAYGKAVSGHMAMISRQAMSYLLVPGRGGQEQAAQIYEQNGMPGVAAMVRAGTKVMDKSGQVYFQMPGQDGQPAYRIPMTAVLGLASSNSTDQVLDAWNKIQQNAVPKSSTVIRVNEGQGGPGGSKLATAREAALAIGRSKGHNGKDLDDWFNSAEGQGFYAKQLTSNPGKGDLPTDADEDKSSVQQEKFLSGLLFDNKGKLKVDPDSAKTMAADYPRLLTAIDGARKKRLGRGSYLTPAAPKTQQLIPQGGGSTPIGAGAPGTKAQF